MFYIKCNNYIIKIIFNHFLFNLCLLLFIFINKKLFSLNYVISDTLFIESFITFIFIKIFLKINFKCHDYVIVFYTFYNYNQFVICCIINN